ncbi:MAG: leucine-rich repeat domain-containing protein [Butyrivibrio sp.]|nr:leucine-rich repeat domain-containing protein [Butyrivibrio sp.]
MRQISFQHFKKFLIFTALVMTILFFSKTDIKAEESEYNGLIEGDVFTDGWCEFKVTKAATAEESGEVTLVKCVNKRIVGFCYGDYLYDINDTDRVYDYDIVSIEENAFRNCSRLQTVQFNSKSKLTTIGKGAFRNCKKIKKIWVMSKLEMIENDAFSGCTKLTYFTTGSKNIKKVGKNAFKNCKNFKALAVPESKTKKYEKMFKKAGAKNVKARDMYE